jgi:glycosyltransferase involved in cell wall biosynthesis
MAPLRVGIIGRIAAWKGQDRFLSAFARAFPDGNEEAIVIGDALFEADQGYAASLSGLARKLGVADRVEFRGFREDIAAELARLDILVHASVTPEPFGQVVVEGMAAGVPVVAADAGGPAEIITDGVDGALYPIGDIDALAGTMRSLATNPSLRDRLGRGGQARAMEFTPARIGAQVVAIYRTVLGLRPNEGLAGR